MDAYETIASNETLLNNATSTAKTYLIEAKETIDDIFGKGYAEKNPELIAAFMRTAATDFHTSIQGRTLHEHLSRIDSALTSISAAIGRRS